MKIVNREFLPKSHVSVHASTIAFHNDHPVFAWFEGEREGDPYVFIRVYNKNGNKDSICMGNKDGVPRWNPILFKHDDKLMLMSKSGMFCDRWQTQLHDITNWDENTSPKEMHSNCTFLPAGVNGAVKTKPIFVNYHMYCGSSVETFADWTSYIEKFSTTGKIEFESRSNPLSLPKKLYQNPYSGKTGLTLGIIQPTLWFDGHSMHCLMRSSYGLTDIYYSKSQHPFEKWDDPKPFGISNPNSSIDVVYHNDRIFLVCNPVELGRLPLSIIEMDKDFKAVDAIEITKEMDEENKGSLVSSEASYPYMIEHGGQLHLTYTYGRSFIEYVTIGI